MKRRLRLSRAAQSDELEIWLYTVQTFGEAQAEKYLDLIDQAKRDIAQDPELIGSKEREDLAPRMRSYRVELSKGRSFSDVKSARHVIFYTLTSREETYVVRILHDRMSEHKQLKPHEITAAEARLAYLKKLMAIGRQEKDVQGEDEGQDLGV